MTTADNADLLQAVQERLPKGLAPLGFTIVEHHEGASFDIAAVSLESQSLRINIERERGPITVGFAAPATPHQSFDSSVVLELLGLSRDATLTGVDIAVVLNGLERLLVAASAELERHFSPDMYPKTRQVLKALQAAQGERRWPSTSFGAT